MPSLEEILHKVVLADSEQINQGTEELREAFKKPDIVQSLCQVMGTSQQAQIRQYSAVLLRKRLSKKRIWLQLSTDVKKGIQDGLIQALIAEPEHLVQNSIAQLIGVIVKHTKNIDQQWPALLQFLQRSIQSNNPKEQELGTLTLSGIADISTEALCCHLPALCTLFKHVLETSTDAASPSVFYTINSMKSFIPVVEQQKNCAKMYISMIPMILNAIVKIAAKDEEKACLEIEFLEELLEVTTSILQPHLSQLVNVCLNLAFTTSLGPMVRNKAILLTGWIARKKKKSFLKLDLLKPTVNIMFELMSAHCDDDEKEEDEGLVTAPEESSPNKVAAQAIDALALCLPPDKLMPLLAEIVEPALQGNDCYKKKAAYLVLAVIVEGCNAYIRNHCLEQFVLCIANGIADPSQTVRNSALYALGQFSDYLQPEINMYAPKLLPVLFIYLEELCASIAAAGKEPAGVDRMFYALECFIENLEDDLHPYLPTLMDRLLLILMSNGTSPHLRRLALSAIGTVAKPAKEQMLPYFATVIEMLKHYIMQPTTLPENKELQVQALDTLGLLARGLGPVHFKPLACETVQLSMALVRSSEDEADIRKAAYGVFGAVSTVLKQEMEPFLNDIMTCIMLSIQNKDDVITHFKENADKAYPVFDEVVEVDEEDIGDENSDSEEDEDDACSDLEGFSLKNSYVEEKEEALVALKELAENLGEKFNPYVKPSFDVVYNSLSYPHEDVKISALNAISQICINWYQMQTIEALAELREGLLGVIPKVAELVHCDCDHDVVMNCMEVYSVLLKELKGLVLQDAGHKEAIVNCVMDVLKCQTECQKQDEQETTADDAETDGDSGDDGEQDELLFEYSADVLAPLGNAMPCEEFFSVFMNLLPIITSKTKKQCSLAQRSFATGMMAECLGPLGETQLPKVINQLLPVLLKLSSDKEEDVRNNAIFGLGELAKHGKECVFPHYPEILQALSSVLTKENGPYVLDNVCGAIARLINTNISGVPLDVVLPAFLQQLPLRSDYDELKPVIECIAYLYKNGCPQLLQHLDRVILTAANGLEPDKIPKETQNEICMLLNCIRNDFPQQFENGVLMLPPKEAKNMEQHFIITT